MRGAMFAHPELERDAALCTSASFCHVSSGNEDIQDRDRIRSPMDGFFCAAGPECTLALTTSQTRKFEFRVGPRLTYPAAK